MRSWLQQFARANLFPDINGPHAIVPWEGLNPLEVLVLQPARFVKVCAISVSPVELEHTSSAIVSKSGHLISACLHFFLHNISSFTKDPGGKVLISLQQ